MNQACVQQLSWQIQKLRVQAPSGSVPTLTALLFKHVCWCFFRRVVKSSGLMPRKNRSTKTFQWQHFTHCALAEKNCDKYQIPRYYIPSLYTHMIGNPNIRKIQCNSISVLDVSIRVKVSLLGYYTSRTSYISRQWPCDYTIYGSKYTINYLIWYNDWATVLLLFMCKVQVYL